MRHVDYTGVSGIGVVAYGVVFSDGQVALRWTSDHPATSIWASLDDVLAVHGHGQATSVQWIDQPADVIDELAASLRPQGRRGRGRNPGTAPEGESGDPTSPAPEAAARVPAQAATNGRAQSERSAQPASLRQPGRHRKAGGSPFSGGTQPTHNAPADASQHNGLT